MQPRAARFVLSALFAIGASVGRPALAGAATTTLVADRDNTLFDGGSTQDFSSGAGSFLFAGFSNVGERRALVHFDLSTLPAGAIVTDASLTLVDSKSATNVAGLELHALTAAFGEGSSDAGNGGMGASATAGDSTWLHRIYPDSAWNTPGGDFSAVSSSQLVVSGTGTYTWTGSGLTADVQRWRANSAANFGWILLDPNPGETSSAQRFNARENADPATRPRLTITYSLPAPVPATGAFGDALLALELALLGSLGAWRGLRVLEERRARS
jgi:hypothetical protein